MQLRDKLGWCAVLGGALFVLYLAAGAPEVTVDADVWRLLTKDPRDEAREQCERYHDLVITWKLITGRPSLPTKLPELEEPLKEDQPPFTKIELDPWGGQYFIDVDGKEVSSLHARERFRIVSPGPDGVAGTDDDIAYPPRE